VNRWGYFTLLGLLGAGLTACSGGAGSSPASFLPAGMRPASSSSQPIKHIIIMVQENRSFDNLFARFPGADGATQGETSKGKLVPLTAHKLTSSLILDNSHVAFNVDYDNGKMDGFNLVYVNEHRCTCAYQYVKQADIQPYWTIAKQYVLGDHMFTTQSSGSFTGHQDLIRGGAEISSTESLIDFPTSEPWGCDSPTGTTTTLLTSQGQYLQDEGPFPCTNQFPSSSYYKTLRDLLDAKNVSWKYYTPSLQTHGGNIWNAFDVISPVRYGPEWTTNISSPETNIFQDISNNALPAVSWVIPDGQNSDHPAQGYWGIKTDTGPAWVAQVVNAIGESPYWDSTAIVVVWDDWGGWYDHVAPPQLDYTGLGFRVPMLVVSSYAKKGYVSHTEYESGSIVRFVEDTFNLGQLGTSDVRATSVGNVLNFNKAPRTFKPISAKQSKAYFLHEHPSNMPVDTE
jgi:phospholipase C